MVFSWIQVKCKYHLCETPLLSLHEVKLLSRTICFRFSCIEAMTSTILRDLGKQENKRRTYVRTRNILIPFQARFDRLKRGKLQSQAPNTSLRFQQRMNPWTAILPKLNIKIAKTWTVFSNNMDTTTRKYSSRAFIWVVTPLGFVGRFRI